MLLRVFSLLISIGDASGTSSALESARAVVVRVERDAADLLTQRGDRRDGGPAAGVKPAARRLTAHVGIKSKVRLFFSHASRKKKTNPSKI